MSQRATIFLRCSVCGNAVIAERQRYDPATAVECLTNECDICNAASGGFGECWYYDSVGNQVSADCEDRAVSV